MERKAGPRWRRIWERLSDRSRTPRRWWNPIVVYRRLPRDVFTEAYKQYAETTNRTMLALLAVGTFCLLTVISTPDKALLAAEGTVKVPFAEASISFLGFVVVAPFLLTVVSVYLHIFYDYWLDMEHERQEYNRILPYVDKTPVEPVPMLFALEDPVSRTLSWFILYALVPFVLAVMTWKAAALSEVGLLLFLMLCGVTSSMIFLCIRRCPETLRRSVNPGRWLILVVLGILIVMSLQHRGWLRRSANLFRADLTEAWLAGVDLQGANLERTRLTRAGLTNTKLQRANMMEANLEKANLAGADLSQTLLTDANLQEADLSYAILKGAVLRSANLRQVKLILVDLREADLQMANLQGALLNSSIEPSLEFSWEDLKLNLRHFVPPSSSKPHLRSFESLMWGGANLQNADLRWADLRQADLKNANLQDANLRGANFQGSINLKPSQVQLAKNWNQAFYSSDLLKSLQLPPDHNEKLAEKLR